MVSFVEQATLEVVDRASGTIDKINSKLQNLLRTMGKSAELKVRVVLTGEDQARRRLDALRRGGEAKIRVSTAGAATAATALAGIARPRVAQIFADVTGSGARRELNEIIARRKVLIEAKVLTGPALLAIDRLIKTRQMDIIARFPLQQYPGAVPISGGGGGAANVPPVPPPVPPSGPRRQTTVIPAPGPRAAHNMGLAERALIYSLLADIRWAVRSATRDAVESTLAGQTATVNQQLTLPEADIPLVDQVAREAVVATQGLGLADARILFTDLRKTVKDPAAFEAMALALARGRERLAEINPETADKNSLALIKILEAAQVSTDPERAVDIIDAVVAGIAQAGDTFDATSYLKALRVSSTAPTLDGEGVFRTILAFDEQGRRLGTRVARLLAVLTKDIGVSDKQQARLEASGLRLPGGGAVDEELLRTNPMLWVERHLTSRIVEAGLDPNNSADAPAIQKLVADLGFVSQEAVAIVSEITGNAERAAALQNKAATALIRTQEAADKHLGSSSRNLAEAFGTAASVGLTPIFEKLAPKVDAFADWLKWVSLTDTPEARMQRVLSQLVATATAVGGALLIWKKVLGRKGPSLALYGAAGSLTGAASKLSAAALALGGGGKAGAAAAGGAGAAAGAGAGAVARQSLAARVAGFLTSKLALGVGSGLYAALRPDTMADGTMTQAVTDELRLTREARLEVESMRRGGATESAVREFIRAQPTSGQPMAGQDATAMLIENVLRIQELRKDIEAQTTELLYYAGSDQRGVGEFAAAAKSDLEGLLADLVAAQKETAAAFNKLAPENRAGFDEGLLGLYAGRADPRTVAALRAVAPPPVPSSQSGVYGPMPFTPNTDNLPFTPVVRLPGDDVTAELSRRLTALSDSFAAGAVKFEDFAARGSSLTAALANSRGAASPIQDADLFPTGGALPTKDRFVSVFERSLQALPAELDDAANDFGPAVAQGILTGAPAIGAAIGEAAGPAIAAAIGSVQVASPPAAAPAPSLGGVGPY